MPHESADAMTDERMAQLRSSHQDVIDAPFETFEADGAIYHSVGLMQAWARGYTDPGTHMSTEPPAWTDAFKAWIADHDAEIAEAFVGPPMIRMRDIDTAEAFKRDWHDRAGERYPYAQAAEYEVTARTNRLALGLSPRPPFVRRMTKEVTRASGLPTGPMLEPVPLGAIQDTLAQIRRRTGCDRRRARQGLTVHAYEAATRHNDAQTARGLARTLLSVHVGRLGRDGLDAAVERAGAMADAGGTHGLAVTADEALEIYLDGGHPLAILGFATADPSIDRIVADRAAELFAHIHRAVTVGAQGWGMLIGLVAMADLFEAFETGREVTSEDYDEDHPLYGMVAVMRPIVDERIARGEPVAGLAGWTAPAAWAAAR